MVEGGAYVIQESVASNVAWRMTKILESIDRPMSGIGSKLLWMTEAAQSLFRTLIKTNDRSRPDCMGPEWSNGLSRALQEDGCSPRSWL